MIRGYDGNIYTLKELNNMRIKDISIDVKGTKILMKRFEDIEISFENTEQYKKDYKKIKKFHEEFNQCLPENKYDLIMKLDDFYIELLIDTEKFFYKMGYIDGKKFNGIF
jgi:hypothetical protein